MTAEYPENMQEFAEWFPTEIACREYLAVVRWGASFVCPRCGSTRAWHMSRGTCRCTQCHHEVSVTAGTTFQDSHVPLRIWFQALWCVVSQKHGVSALGLARVLGIKRYETAWKLLMKIRSAMIRPNRERLGGLVEVDEVFLGGVRTRIGGRSPIRKVLILVAAEDTGHGIGRIRIRIIPGATLVSLNAAMREMIEPGSTVRTDGWSGYQGVVRNGYRHIVVKHESSNPGDDPTPLVHRIASLLKRWLLGTHQGGTHHGHTQLYLDEFVFRFNRRTSRSRGKLFYRLIQHMTADQHMQGG